MFSEFQQVQKLEIEFKRHVNLTLPYLGRFRTGAFVLECFSCILLAASFQFVSYIFAMIVKFLKLIIID